MKKWLFAFIILFTAIGMASADTVFFENFSSGAGQFSGFESGNCAWNTPGENATFIGYFGDDLFAEVDKSGCLQPIWNSSIVSTSIDLTSFTGAELSFKHYFTQSGSISMGQVSISLDNGATWNPVYTTSGNVSGQVETIAIPQADEQANLKIRFYYSYYGGLLASKWGIDDVSITASPIADDDTTDDDIVDDDAVDDDAVDDDAVDDDAVDDDIVDDDAVDDDATDDDAVDDDTVDSDDIAYIYSINLSRAVDFQTFLESEGYRVTLIQIAELDASPDLSVIDVFMVDSDTTLDWDVARSQLVLNTAKPIIGDGDGMSLLADTEAFFGGDNYAGVVDQVGLQPQGLGHPIWHTPYEIITSDQANIIPVLTSAMTLRALHNDGSNPLGVQFLGQSEVYDEYYSMAVEDVTYAVWAFGVMGPSLYTEKGKQLLVNLIEYVQTEPMMIGYFYDQDDVTALAYQNYLESVGYIVDLFDLTELSAKIELSSYTLFMVDDNAGEGDWNETNSVLLTESGKPIIANNQGIHVFDFSEQYLTIDNCLQLDPASGFTPQNLDHTLWHDPFELGLSETETAMLTEVAAYLGLHDDGTDAMDVEFLGRDGAYLNHYPLAIEGQKYAMWAYGAVSPELYSNTAKNLLINLIEYLQGEEVTDDDTSDDDAIEDDDSTDDDSNTDDDVAGDDDDDDDDGGCGC